MILASMLLLDCGGLGSGCRGENCGRPSSGRIRWREGKKDPWSLNRKFVEVPLKEVAVNRMNAPLSQKIVQKYVNKMREGRLVTAPKATKYRSDRGNYLLDDGHHRFAAAKKFGAKTIKLQLLD